MSRTFALLLLVALALAGCSDNDAHPDARLKPGPDGNAGEPGADGPPSSAVGGNATPPPGNDSTPMVANDTAPHAVLGASPTRGAAPLSVKFEMDGGDADGDEISWSLDADGDGESDANGNALPADYEHIFDIGTFTANLTVAANGTTAHATLTIEVVAPAPAAPAPAGQTVDADYVIAAEGCLAPLYEAGELDAGSAAADRTDEVIRIQFDVVPGTIGNTYTARFTFDVGYLYLAVDFFDADDALISSQNTGESPNMGDHTVTGTVPGGAVTGVLFACAGPAEAHVHYEA